MDLTPPATPKGAPSELQRRLLGFGLGIIAVCAVLFVTFWVVVRVQVVPILMEHVRTKAVIMAASLDHELAVPLASGDKRLVATLLAAARRDPDFAFVVVRDADGQVVARAGRTAPHAFHGRPGVARRTLEGFVAWAPIELEGVPMGAVAAGFGTERVDAVLRWLALFAIVGGVLAVAAVVLAIRESQTFVAPIHDVIDLSKRIARGDYQGRLDGSPPGELGQLVDALNGMADALESRTREIEEKRAEVAASLDALSRTQTRLVDASRRAGMAEVATGVLHNVGNVLNSVNVSAEVLERTLRASKSVLLPRVAAMLAEHEADLAEFLVNDPRGAKLPAFLAALCDQLDAERCRMLEEIASLRGSIDHIKSVVSSQQSFARSRGLTEVVSLADVVDTALGIEDITFRNNEIRVVREVEPLPPACVDRNKLLQILINLLSNARHAMVGGPSDVERVLRIGIGRTDAGMLAIEVQDTGSGIPAENLRRVFEHGFTTKPRGHGFGLHSSALAAMEMGGSLRVNSEGPGRGATFTLELPFAEAVAA